MLKDGLAPCVQLSGLLKVQSLMWPMKEGNCIVRQLPEDWEYLQKLAKKLNIPYHFQGAASFGYHCLLQLLRHKRGVTHIGHGQCFLCGAPSEEIHHQPPLSRNPEKSSEHPVCKACHAEITNEDAKFDSGWKPLTSTLNPTTAEYLHLAREKPFVAEFSKKQQRAEAEIDFRRAYRTALEYPGDTWPVFSPTDSWREFDGKIAPLSFIDAGPATCIRENAYLGRGWYHRLSLIHI